MANGFRWTGPACCCCNHLYIGDTFGGENIRRYDTVGNAPGKAADFYAYTHFTDGHRAVDFDPVHKLAFVTRGVPPTDNQKVFRYDEALENQFLLTTLSSELPTSIASDSDNEKVYIAAIDSPFTATGLHSVNHDGTGYTSIGSLTNPGLNPIIQLHYDRSNGKLYYLGSPLASGREVRRIDTDGTNDTLIASPAGGASSQIDSVTTDNQGNYLYYSDHAGIIGQTTSIYRCDLDGTGPVAIVTSAPIVGGVTNETYHGLQWSEKQQRLYFFFHNILTATASDTTRGLCSCKFDGSDFQLHIARGNGTDWWSFGTSRPLYWRLGCGYETTGAGSTA